MTYVIFGVLLIQKKLFSIFFIYLVISTSAIYQIHNLKVAFKQGENIFQKILIKPEGPVAKLDIFGLAPKVLVTKN